MKYKNVFGIVGWKNSGKTTLVESLVKYLTEQGYQVSTIKHAHHSFDRDGPLLVKENGYILEDCRFLMRDDGTVYMDFLNFPMTTPFLQKIGLFTCAKRGPTYGGNKIAKTQALIFSEEFMKMYLYEN